MKYVGRFFYYLIQWTWGIIQNLVGLAYSLSFKGAKREFYHGCLITYHEGDWGGVSMGMFVIMNGTRNEVWTKDTKLHEFGHTIQSIILGPLYFFVIGIPSAIWCNGKRWRALRADTTKNVSYFDFYPEKWANHLGQLVTKEKIIEPR